MNGNVGYVKKLLTHRNKIFLFHCLVILVMLKSNIANRPWFFNPECL